MPRRAIQADVFTAIAEPRRRQILDLLARRGESPVGDVVTALRLPQPAVSKHLGMLRSIGVVAVRRQGQSRLYRLNGQGLKPVHDWVVMFEQFWAAQLERIKARAERRAAQLEASSRTNN